VAFVSQEGDDMTKRMGTIKITGMEKTAVEAALGKTGAEIIDIR
jgi:hypothetical protein